jgi:1,2-dihydroxy-3-keto-5-methylthiopentene dioxygenase
MSRLTIFKDNDSTIHEDFTQFAEIADRLEAIGVQFEQWQADRPLAADAGQEEVLAAYQDDIERLNTHHGFATVDVVALGPDHPQREEMRAKFLDEHTHADFEIRFFVDGSGIFYIHKDGHVYAVTCEKGDLISVPANTTHWFDMGTRPDFKCIRFFTTPEGWVGEFTGSDIAGQFPDYDQMTGTA